MSIQDARATVIARADDYAGWPDFGPEAEASRRSLVASLDALILEVQAEMPCEYKPDGLTCNDVHRFPYDEQPCRSCAAKVRLADRAKPEEAHRG